MLDDLVVFLPIFKVSKFMSLMMLCVGWFRSFCETIRSRREGGGKKGAFVLRGKAYFLMFSILTFLFCYSVSVRAISLKEPVSQNLSGLSPADQKKLQDYIAAQDVMKLILPRLEEDKQGLMLEVKLQSERVRGLEREIAELKKPDENGIATILLSAVSVIITVLGVLIAILAILGYRNIKKEAIKDSRKTARETVKLIVVEEIPKATEESIIKLIEGDKFDGLIQKAVENIVYRDTSMLDDITDEGVLR